LAYGAVKKRGMVEPEGHILCIVEL